MNDVCCLLFGCRSVFARWFMWPHRLCAWWSLTSSPKGSSEAAFCAGRLVVAHERTAMRRAAAGWVCPECGEVWEEAS